MNNLSPRVSVVVPCFNEPTQIIRESLESIRQQTFSDFECIVIDESTDFELSEICRLICEEDPRFTYIHPSIRLGLPKSLNLGISHARAKLIARFDSDDICMPDRLAIQVEFLDKYPEISVVGSGLDIINEFGNVLAQRYYPCSPKEIARGMHLTTTIAHPTVMFRKESINLYGEYDPTYKYAEDLDLWLRWMNQGARFANLPRSLVCYRQTHTHRHNQHWYYNLRARISNFKFDYFLIRILGIISIATWSVLPRILKNFIFRLMILQSNSRKI